MRRGSSISEVNKVHKQEEARSSLQTNEVVTTFVRSPLPRNSSILPENLSSFLANTVLPENCPSFFPFILAQIQTTIGHAPVRPSWSSDHGVAALGVSNRLARSFLPSFPFLLSSFFHVLCIFLSFSPFFFTAYPSLPSSPCVLPSFDVEVVAHCQSSVVSR